MIVSWQGCDHDPSPLVGQVQERLDAIEMLEEVLSSADVYFSFHVLDAIAALLGCRAAAVLLPTLEDVVIL
jgi:hypothetical protein